MVRSIVILMRQKADHPSLTGMLTYGDPAHRLKFRYEVVRLWKLPPESFLTGSLGLVPLAVLGKLPSRRKKEESLRDIVREIERRLLAEVSAERAAVFMRAAVILTSTRIASNKLPRIFQGVGLVSEIAASDYFTEQGEIQGRIKECRTVLIKQGRTKFGHVDQTAEVVLNSIADIDRLERMVEAIFAANSWQDLVSTP
jgi:hypothetical protein